MIVLGIDPGLANTGFGVVRRDGSKLLALDGGVIKTASTEALPDRLLKIREAVELLIDRYNPEAVVTESLFFGKNTSSALAVGQAKGVVLLAAAQHGLQWVDYSPQQIKSAVCGKGAAEKGQVQRMVQYLLGLNEPPTPDHAADALAAAICHSNHSPLRTALIA